MVIDVDVVSDAICPWCYIGKRRLEKAVASLGGRHEIRVRWKPYQLNPNLPPGGMDRKAYRLKKFGSEETVRVLDLRVIEAARDEGLAFALDRIRTTPNTFDAHRLIWLSGTKGVQDAVVERLFRAFFMEGRNIGDRGVLVELGAEAGLAHDEIRAFLESSQGTKEIHKEERQARDRGVEAVPTFTIGGRFVVSGAQPSRVFLEAFEAASLPA